MMVDTEQTEPQVSVEAAWRMYNAGVGDTNSRFTRVTITRLTKIEEDGSANYVIVDEEGNTLDCPIGQVHPFDIALSLDEDNAE